MDPKDFSRRDFLKAFAALSSASLLLSMQAGCGDPPATAAYGPAALYGPAPINGPRVNAIYFLDDRLCAVPLQDSQSVPLLAKFLVEFTDNMNASVLPAVYLTGPGEAPVAYDNKTWFTARILTLSPAQDLSPATEYTLRIGDDAEDLNGEKIYLTESATAAFRTVVA